MLLFFSYLKEYGSFCLVSILDRRLEDPTSGEKVARRYTRLTSDGGSPDPLQARQLEMQDATPRNSVQLVHQAQQSLL